MPVKAAPLVEPTSAEICSAEDTSTTFATIDDDPELSSPFPTSEPLTAALYFDSPDGFGDWRLILPQRASKDLRDARKKNPKLFEIILKKMK